MDSRIKNTVYGLAIGDALGYPTEFISIEESLDKFGGQELSEWNDNLTISDDTQMSLALFNGFIEWQASGDHENGFVYHVATEFLNWLDDGRNNRAPGMACLNSLKALKQQSEGSPRNIPSQDLAEWGKSTTPDSMGSGTVMRSPWLGMLHGLGLMDNRQLANFSKQHSMLTHGHDSAAPAAHLTALITSELISTGYHGTGEVLGMVCKYANVTKDPEILEMKTRLLNIPEEWFESDDHENADVGQWFSSHWKATNVLGSAIAVFAASNGDPDALVKRLMFNSQDTDTLGAIAGAFLGAASNDDNLWGHLPSLIEDDYQYELNEVCNTASMLSSGRYV